MLKYWNQMTTIKSQKVIKITKTRKKRLDNHEQTQQAMDNQVLYRYKEKFENQIP